MSFRAGVTAYHQDDHTRALDIFQTFDSSFNALFNQAVVHGRTRDHEAAVEVLDRAIGLEASSLIGTFERAVQLFLKGDYTRSLLDASKVLELLHGRPRHAYDALNYSVERSTTLCLRALCCQRLGVHDRSMGDFTAGAAANPSVEASNAIKVCSARNAKNDDQARTILRLSPGGMDVLFPSAEAAADGSVPLRSSMFDDLDERKRGGDEDIFDDVIAKFKNTSFWSKDQAEKESVKSASTPKKTPTRSPLRERNDTPAPSPKLSPKRPDPSPAPRPSPPPRPSDFPLRPSLPRSPPPADTATRSIFPDRNGGDTSLSRYTTTSKADVPPRFTAPVVAWDAPAATARHDPGPADELYNSGSFLSALETPAPKERRMDPYDKFTASMLEIRPTLSEKNTKVSKAMRDSNATLFASLEATSKARPAAAVLHDSGALDLSKLQPNLQPSHVERRALNDEGFLAVRESHKSATTSTRHLDISRENIRESMARDKKTLASMPTKPAGFLAFGSQKGAVRNQGPDVGPPRRDLASRGAAPRLPDAASVLPAAFGPRGLGTANRLPRSTSKAQARPATTGFGVTSRNETRKSSDPFFARAAVSRMKAEAVSGWSTQPPKHTASFPRSGANKTSAHMTASKPPPAFSSLRFQRP